ncbi:hypothetical protein M8818_004227 [Zalaria obscura]|uniref:Uncharacterized protein n=1 Tax=Zalaria obscura TaxID=2024903 RepID=A0ACC3SCS1_9PEZI
MSASARQCWRFGKFVQSQTAQIPPATPPLLPFLYPRCFATASTAQAFAPAEDLQGGIVDGAQDSSTPKSRQHGLDGRKAARDNDILKDTKPTRSLARRIVRRIETRDNAQGSRYLGRPQYRGNDDWRPALEELRKHTPGDPEDFEKRIETLTLPEGTHGVFAGDLHDLVAEIMLMTDCHMQVSRLPNQSDRIFQGLTLAGTRPSIQLAKQRLDVAVNVVWDNKRRNKTEERLRISTIDPKVSMPGDDPARVVWTQKRMPRAHSLNAIKEPQSWTVLSFADYIDKIANSKLPRLVRRKAYAADHSLEAKMHVEKVSQILVDAFSRYETLPFISPASCSVALEFLIKHAKVPQALQIFQLCDSRGIRLLPGVFHVFMRHAAKINDMHNYQYALRLMLKRNIRPTWETWAILVHLVARRSGSDAQRSARFIARFMDEQGFFREKAALMSVSEAFVAHDYRAHITAGKPSGEFMQCYAREWGGPEWFTEVHANKMINIRAERGNYLPVQLLLKWLRQRGRQPTVATLNVILKHCAEQRNIDTAVYFLRDLTHGPVQSVNGANEDTTPRQTRQERLFEYDQLTFHRLFRLAYSGRHYNMLRVIWRYACMEGHVSWPMQQAMTQKTAWTIPERSETDRYAVSLKQLFDEHAAKVAIGLDTELSEHTFSNTEQDEDRSANLYPDKSVDDSPNIGRTASQGASLRESDSVREETREGAKDDSFDIAAVAQTASTQSSARMDQGAKDTERLSREGTPGTGDGVGPEAISPLGNEQSTRGHDTVESQKRNRYLRQLVEHDMAQVGLLEPKRPLWSVLQEAAKLDKQWFGRGIGRNPDLRWMLQNAIKVPVRSARGEKIKRLDLSG